MLLRKADAEQLLSHLEDDDVAGLANAVAGALARTLDQPPDSAGVRYEALIVAAGAIAGWDQSRVRALRAQDPDALCSLATELCELRGLGGVARR